MSSLEMKDEASQSIVNFLKANVPKSDIPNIEAELKKDFLLAKKRSKEQNTKKQIKKKSKVITRKEKKALGFFSIPRNGCVCYKDMLGIHKIWCGYIAEILELDTSIPNASSKNWEQLSQSMYKADFHGSLLEVVRSKCPSYVGKKGICIMDTKNTFKIVSVDNIVTTIPKKECLFQVHVNNVTICIFGKHLCVKPAERSTKKLKNRLMLEL